MGNCWPKPVNSHRDTEGLDWRRSPARADGQNRGKKSPEEIVNGGVEGKIMTPNLKMFTLQELKIATKDFKPISLLGEGGFGRVFKGFLDEKTLAPSKFGIGMPIAVKKSNPDSEQGFREWQTEVKFLGTFSHPNLVKLIGYCWEEDNHFLLVYEFMPKGSLENHLFRGHVGAETLTWKRRMKIAIGAARGLVFLHSTHKKVIYRDFKASNILLDEEFNAKLSDFGLAKFGPEEGKSHVTTRLLGTTGYAAPEYISTGNSVTLTKSFPTYCPFQVDGVKFVHGTGHLYVKSDVYGFGVVLLEMLTGQRVLDVKRPSKLMNLLDWAVPCLRHKSKLKNIMDPSLSGQCPSKAAFATAQLILACLEQDLKRRPNMDHVLNTLEDINCIQMRMKTPTEGYTRNSVYNTLPGPSPAPL